MDKKEYISQKFKNLQSRLEKGKLTKSSQKRYKQDKTTREQVEKHNPRLLRPNDISGDYDTDRALRTTLGVENGKSRVIQVEDLKVFAENIKTMQQRYKAGITPNQVIALSLDDDIERANKQIKYSMPKSRKGDIIHFITDASGENGANHHYVNVQFLGFNILRLSPNEVTQSMIKNKLANGTVKFECNCGRYRYWYRYVNSIAGTTLGRTETVFPKIRNPNLTGVACKHILRTMHWIKSGHGIHYLEKELHKARQTDSNRQTATSKSEKEAHIEQMMQIANDGRKSNIRVSSQRRMREIEKMHKRAKNMAKSMKAYREKNKQTQNVEKTLQQLMKQSGLNEKQLKAILSKMEKK